MLMFAVMVQKHWWENLLAFSMNQDSGTKLYHRSRYSTTLIIKMLISLQNVHADAQKMLTASNLDPVLDISLIVYVTK